MGQGDQTEPRLAARHRLSDEAAKKFKATAAAEDVRPASSNAFKNYAAEVLRTYRRRGTKNITAETRESWAAAARFPAVPGGVVPSDWLKTRRVGTATAVSLWFVDAAHSESPAHLREGLASRLVNYGLND